MAADHLYFAWSVDPEGHPWVQHECAEGQVHTFRCPPPWRIEGDGLAPSFNCVGCGRHVILGAADRAPWEAIDPSTGTTTPEATS